MYYRLRSSRVGFERPQHNIVYTMLGHEKSAHNDKRMDILNRNIGKYRTNGLRTVNYTLKGILEYPLFTKILVDIGNPNSNL